MSEFASLVVCKNLRNVNFDLVPKSLRTKMIDQLGCFEYLRKLEFGFSHSPWLFKAYQESLEKVRDSLLVHNKNNFNYFTFRTYQNSYLLKNL